MRVPNAFDLAKTLKLIIQHDQDYDRRYGLVLRAMYEADMVGFKTGIRIDPQEPDWPVVFIELPTGQISWHLSSHEREWDGHTTEEKLQRIERFREYMGG